MQHIEDRIKRNFDNRLTKPDSNDNGEPEAHDSEEHFEDVLTESQIAVVNVKQSKDFEEKENHTQEESVIVEPSESCVVENKMELNNSEIMDNNTEKLNECQEDKRASEIDDKTLENCESINAKNDVEEEHTNEITNF